MKQEEREKPASFVRQEADTDLTAAAKFFDIYRSTHSGKQIIDMIRYESQNADPRCLSEGDVLFGIFPENITKMEYGSYGFNPGGIPVSIEWRSYPGGVRRYDDLEKNDVPGTTHICIRCIKDGKTAYSAEFDDSPSDRTQSGPEESPQLQYGGFWRYGRMDEKTGLLITDDPEMNPKARDVIRHMDEFLRENAPYGVTTIPRILNGLNEFRGLQLSRHPLDVSQKQFENLVMDELQKNINPMYQDMVRLKIDGQDLYVHVPGWRGNGVSVMDDAVADCPSVYSLHDGFCDGSWSLGDVKDILMEGVRNTVDSWEALQHTFCYDRIMDMIVPEKISQKELYELNCQCRRQGIGCSVESIWKHGEQYIFRVYPFRGNETYRDRFFLVTTEMTRHWNVNKSVVLDDAFEEALREQEKREKISTIAEQNRHFSTGFR